MDSQEFDRWGERIARVRSDLDSLGPAPESCKPLPLPLATVVRQDQKASEYLLIVLGQVFKEASHRIRSFGGCDDEK